MCIQGHDENCPKYRHSGSSAKYETARLHFQQIISAADRRPPIRDAFRDVAVRISKQVMVSPEFLDLAYDSSTIERAFDPALDNDPDIKMV